MIKVVGNAGYAHRSNVKELAERKVPKELREGFINFMQMVDEVGLNYDVVKYNKGNITLIESPDWDTANEPSVGMSKRWKAGEWFDANGRININWTTRCASERVYHNKWQFVADDYTGFDIEKAKQRTLQWNAIPGVDKKRIGNRKYWRKFLADNGMEE